MTTAESIVSQLKTLGNQQIAAHSQRFFRTAPGEYGEGDLFLGVRVPVLRTLASQHRTTDLSQICRCLQSPYHEMRLFSLIWLANHFQRGDTKVQAEVYKQYVENRRYINNWDLVDTSAAKIIGAYLTERSRKPLYQWAKSPSLWDRRIAIISTYHFIRAGDYDDTLRLSQLLLNDKEDLIHKAVGWMLREIGKRDLATEERFLKSAYQQMPRTMLRYAIEKFTEPRRKQYLTGKI